MRDGGKEGWREGGKEGRRKRVVGEEEEGLFERKD